MKRIFITIMMFCTMAHLCAFSAPEEGANEELELSEVTQESVLIDLSKKILTESQIEAINSSIDKSIISMNIEMNKIEDISDKHEWYRMYKNIVNKYSFVLDSPETIYDYYTDEELDMLFRVVEAEIGEGHTFEQKSNVASVILNRLSSDLFPDNLHGILTADQFSTVSSGAYKTVEVSEETVNACEYVFQFGDTTNGALFFDSDNSLNYEFIMNDGAHNFYRKKENN